MKRFFSVLVLLIALPLDASACLWFCAEATAHEAKAGAMAGHCSERADEPRGHSPSRPSREDRSPGTHDCEACELAAARAVPPSGAGLIGVTGSTAFAAGPSAARAIRVAPSTTRSRAPPEPADARIPFRGTRAPLQI